MMRPWILVAILTTTLSSAATHAAPPVVSYLFPAGGQCGTSVEVLATGTFERWPVQARASGRGVTIKAAKEKGKLTVAIAGDAEPGTYWVWLYDQQGASVPQPFIVGTLPEVREQEPNDDPKSPQRLPFAAVTVNGRLEKAGDVDCFSLVLQKGQTLVAAMEAWATLRSPMDSVLQVLDPDGFVLDQNNDTNGLDPFLAVPIPKDGVYVVRTFAFPAVPDTTIRLSGGENFVYRLTLTTGGYADHPHPLAVQRDDPTAIQLVGWNIPAAAGHVVAPNGAADQALARHPAIANVVRVRAEPHPCVVKPSTVVGPFAITAPVTVTSCLAHPRAVDQFSIKCAKGQALTLRAESHEWSQPVAAVIRVADAAGVKLAQAEPPGVHADTGLSFTPPADGVYLVTIRDLYDVGGGRSVYRLRVTPAAPDFVLLGPADRLAVVAGQTLDLPVTVQRLNGFAGEIVLRADDLPAGVEVVALPGTDPAKLVLRLSVKPDAITPGPIRIVGRAKTGPAIEHAAITLIPPPFEGAPHARTDLYWLTVTRPPVPKAK
jgi:hypothetical protein